MNDEGELLPLEAIEHAHELGFLALVVRRVAHHAEREGFGARRPHDRALRDEERARRDPEAATHLRSSSTGRARRALPSARARPAARRRARRQVLAGATHRARRPYPARQRKDRHGYSRDATAARAPAGVCAPRARYPSESR